MNAPKDLHPTTFAGELIPIVFAFNESVDGAAFTFTHSLWGEITGLGVDRQVSVPITGARASALVVGTSYTYTLVINPGVEGAAQLVARGVHRHLASEYTP